MESLKIILMNLFLRQQQRNRHRGQTYGHREKEGEGEMYGESNMETYIMVYKIHSQWEFAICLRELKQGLCINLEGWDGEGDGREVQKGGTYVYLWATLAALLAKITHAGDLGLILELGRYPGEGKGYPLQYSGLKNSMDYTVHGVINNQTQLSNFHTSTCMLLLLLLLLSQFIRVQLCVTP